MSENIKDCPFCGSSVSVERVPLKHYPGCVIFEIKCLNCGCERALTKNDSIYRTEQEARANAIVQWNERSSAVNVKPVVRGEWICVDDDKNIWQCTHCGEEVIIEAGTPSDNEWWFCAHCGADMRREASDEVYNHAIS